MLDNQSISDIIDLVCSFCNDPENITAYDRAMYDIHLKYDCQQKLNVAIKNASDDVLIEIIKDGISITNNHDYCTYSEVFILEELALKELTIRGIDPVTLKRKENVL